MLLAGTGVALAQPAVFRCGQEYTNAPADLSRCERLAPQAVTVIEGTRVQAAAAPVARSASEPASAAVRAEAGAQKQRDEMARTIVAAELDKARQRQLELQQEYQRAQARPGRDAEPSTVRTDERQAALKAALERAQRDVDSLQRELERRGAAGAP